MCKGGVGEGPHKYIQHISGSISCCLKLKTYTQSRILRKLSLITALWITLSCTMRTGRDFRDHWFSPVSKIEGQGLCTTSRSRSHKQDSTLCVPPPRAHSTLPRRPVTEWEDWEAHDAKHGGEAVNDTQAGSGGATDTLEALVCSRREQQCEDRQECTEPKQRAWEC